MGQGWHTAPRGVDRVGSWPLDNGPAPQMRGNSPVLEGQGYLFKVENIRQTLKVLIWKAGAAGMS